MIELNAPRQSFERRELDIVVIRPCYMLADCMTKLMGPVRLRDVVRSGRLTHLIRLDCSSRAIYSLRLLLFAYFVTK